MKSTRESSIRFTLSPAGQTFSVRCASFTTPVAKHEIESVQHPLGGLSRCLLYSVFRIQRVVFGRCRYRNPTSPDAINLFMCSARLLYLAGNRLEDRVTHIQLIRPILRLLAGIFQIAAELQPNNVRLFFVFGTIDCVRAGYTAPK